MKKLFSYIVMALAVISMVSCAPKHDKTIANLKAAIDGETAASAKYAAYAEQAARDSLYAIQAMFKATSEAEAIHVKNHQAVLAELGVTDYVPAVPEFEVKTTAENLVTATEGETYEFTEMYPVFIRDAEAEKVQGAVVSFNFAQDAEKKHAVIYQDATAKLATPEMLASVYYICPRCGNAYAGVAAEACELCQAGSGNFLVFQAIIPAIEVAGTAAM